MCIQSYSSRLLGFQWVLRKKKFSECASAFKISAIDFRIILKFTKF